MLEGPARKSHRLPNDTAGILEDRIEADRHDFEAYLALARYQRDKTKLEDARETYEKLLKVVPACVCCSSSALDRC
jgi:cleavage stimulation factor subunit 3